MQHKLKPHQLVVVKKDGYHYFGEVMSHPIPVDSARPGTGPDNTVVDIAMATKEGMTVMVRRVPGFPGTLEEMPVSIIQEQARDARRMNWVHYAQILPPTPATRRPSGSLRTHLGSFPTDMLRYDFAAPVNFKIEPTVTGDQAVVLPGFEGFEGLWIASMSTRRMPSWTPDRWRSFGWTIQPTKTLAYERGAV